MKRCGRAFSFNCVGIYKQGVKCCMRLVCKFTRFEAQVPGSLMRVQIEACWTYIPFVVLHYFMSAQLHATSTHETGPKNKVAPLAAATTNPLYQVPKITSHAQYDSSLAPTPSSKSDCPCVRITSSGSPKCASTLTVHHIEPLWENLLVNEAELVPVGPEIEHGDTGCIRSTRPSIRSLSCEGVISCTSEKGESVQKWLSRSDNTH